MSKVRDKLRALLAPRPTELPEGIEVKPLEPAGSDASADAPPRPKVVPSERPEPRKKQAKPAAKPRPKVATEPRPKVTPDAPEPRPKVVAEPRPKVVAEPRPKVVAEPRPKGVAEPRPKVTPDAPEPRPKVVSPPPRERRTAPPAQPHRNVFPRPGTTVVRRDAFARWRSNRGNEPDTDSTSLPTPDPAPAARAIPEPGAPTTATEHLAAGKVAWASNRATRAAAHLETALDLGLSPRDWWSAARTLVDVYLALGRDDDARVVLEELVDAPTSDPFPFLALADAIEAEEPQRASDLRARAKRIAPWV